MLASLNASRTWQLNIHVTDLNVEKAVNVNGQTHIGQVMLDLVEKLDVATDWSDHALWHPERSLWLIKPRITLEAYGVIGDCSLLFTPVHKVLKLQMPDLQVIDMRVNFSIGVFHAVKEICTDFGVRHPEELSLLKPSDLGHKKREKSKSVKKKNGAGSLGSSETNLSSGSLENGKLATDRQLSAGSNNIAPGSPGSPKSVISHKSSNFSFSESDSLNPYSTSLSPMLANSPTIPNPDALEFIQRPKTIQERSAVNVGWLDSSKSLMEQTIKEFDYLILRYKFFNFFDLNSKVDEVRINQIYEQAKWQILTEEIECTEEEAITFGALQFQVKVSSTSPQTMQNNAEDVDDIDAALNDLQMTLEGTTATNQGSSKPSLTQIPEMSDTLSLVKAKKLGMKSVKPYWFVFRDTHISYYKTKEESHGAPIIKANLKDCEVIPLVNVAKNKFNIKLKIPGQDMIELELSCNSDVQYARWMAACRLASKGKTMADPTYDVEISGIKTFIGMQKDKDDTDGPQMENSHLQSEDFVPPRLLNKYKSKQIAARILEAHSGFTKYTLLEAKMNYIRQWKALPEFGISTFNVRFKGVRSKKAEILGISPSRMVRMDPATRETLKEWRYSAMKSWNVNWETREMIVQCEGETVIFSCIGFDVKIVHEFIGGYIFLSMRKDVNSPPEEELFFKLTGGWV
eukprot:gene20277-22263_t